MTAIAETLDVARSNLIERVAKKRAKRTTYDKADDVRLVPMIRELVDLRPTYGYRRVTALLNRKLVAAGEPRVNHKRIYRLMELHGWLLQRRSPYPARARWQSSYSQLEYALVFRRLRDPVLEWRNR
jgi:putative transposase